MRTLKAPTLPGLVVILNGPAGLDDQSPDYFVLPAEEFLGLTRVSVASSREACGYIAYGHIDLMERAFEQGCADYLREPWALLELRARLRRLSRKSFLFEGRLFELRDRHLVGEGIMIDLGESEYSLMSLLFNNAPHPVPRLSAQKALWHAFGDKENALSRCVTSLRRKMDSVHPGLGSRLHAIRGFGYRIDL